MHNCSCCAACQYDLNTLRNKHQSLLIDYPILKEKMQLAYQTQQLYKQENIQLHNTRVEQKLRIDQLEMQLKDYHLFLQRQSQLSVQDEKLRRESNKIDELNRIIQSKNSELTRMKEDLLRTNQENSILRKENEQFREKIKELGESVKTANERSTVLESKGKQQGEERQETTLSDTLDQERVNSWQRRETITFRGCQTTKAQASPPPSMFRRQCTPERLPLNFVQQKIRILQRENKKLREKLLTHI